MVPCCLQGDCSGSSGWALQCQRGNGEAAACSGLRCSPHAWPHGSRWHLATNRGGTQVTRTNSLNMSVLMCPVLPTCALPWCSCSTLVCTAGTYELFCDILGQWMYWRMAWVMLFHHFASFNCTVNTIQMALLQIHVCSVAQIKAKLPDVNSYTTAVFYRSVLKSTWGFSWVRFIELVYIHFLKKK